MAFRTDSSLEQAGHTVSKSCRFLFKNKHTRSSFLIYGTARALRCHLPARGADVRPDFSLE